MTRRQALQACGLLPFFQTTDRAALSFTMPQPNYRIEFDQTRGTLAIVNKTRVVSVSIDEIMDALDPPK